MRYVAILAILALMSGGAALAQTPEAQGAIDAFVSRQGSSAGGGSA